MGDHDGGRMKRKRPTSMTMPTTDSVIANRIRDIEDYIRSISRRRSQTATTTTIMMLLLPLHDDDGDDVVTWL
jgi:hypothetical protein